MGNSFYGGRHGHPFKIAKVFKTVKEMTEVFQDPTYLEVAFDDYVLIDCDNKNNPEHGQLYKRDTDINSGRNITYYNYNNNTFKWDAGQTPAYGARFVGNVSGPQGEGTRLKFISSKKTEIAEDADILIDTGSWDLSSGTLVPGKDEKGNQNDKISYEAYSFKGEDGKPVTEMFLQIPYTVIDINTSEIEGENFNVVENPITNPFHQTFDLQTPSYLKKKHIKIVHNDYPDSEIADVLVGGIILAYSES